MDPKLILKNKGLLISSVFILTILILEVIFRDTLVDFSIEIIIHLQTKLPNFMRYIFHTVAGLADPDIILPVYLLSLSLQVNKFFLVKVGIYISSIGYFLSVVKTIYANPRPYWIRPYMEDLPGYIPPGIQPFEKYAEYGNPSGHAFFSIAFYGYLFYVFIKNQQKKQLKASANRSQERLIDEENPEIMTQEKNINMPAEETVGFSGTKTTFPF